MSDTLKFDTDEILAGIQSWVEVETPTDAPEAINGLMDKVGGDYAELGAKVERIPGRDGYGDLMLVRAPWGGDEKGVLVMSHLDTVHPLGTLKTMPFRVDGDIAYGPGIYDMKGGAYLGFNAFRELVRNGRQTPLPVTFLYVSEEEVGSPISREVIVAAAEKAKYILVTEPAREGGKIVTARKGSARFDITIHGKASHSGVRHQDGRNAIKELARQVLDLEAMTDYDLGLTGNVGVISGGTRANVVPALAHAAVDMRVPTPEVAEEAIAKVMAMKAYDPDIRVEITGGLNRPPYVKGPGIAALFDHAKGLAAEIGFDLQDLTTGGGSDGNLTAHLAPTLDGLGIDGKGGHTNFEQLYISSIAPRAELMLRLLETLK